jgi:hypothetical protein
LEAKVEENNKRIGELEQLEQNADDVPRQLIKARKAATREMNESLTK